MSAWYGAATAAIGTAGNLYLNSGSKTSGGGSSQKKLSQSGVDKLIYDIMSSDKGLANLAGGENFSGGYGSSTKGLMAQDLVAKVTGEIANVTAETVDTSNAKNTKGTVICTELVRQGLLDDELYGAGAYHFSNLHPYVVRGYQSWAIPCVPILAENYRLARLVAPLATARYEYIVNKKFSVFGLMSVHVAQPVCFVIGAVLNLFNQNSSVAVQVQGDK